MSQHRKRTIRLGRSYNQRKALLRGQLNALIENGSITTTLVKAKLTQAAFDKLVTKAKVNTLHKTRLIAASLANPKNALKLVNSLTPQIKDRPSGFTRIKKIGPRRGDAALMVSLELVDQLAESPKAVPVKTKKAGRTTKITKAVKTTKPKAASKKEVKNNKQ